MRRRIPASRGLATGVAAVAAGLGIGLRSPRARRNRPLFGFCYGLSARRAERGDIGQRRGRLLGYASGLVLDLGVGTGESFKHVAPGVTGVVAVDPNAGMVRRARRRATEAAAPAWLLRATGEALPFADASFDTAVVILVLCTVNGLDATVTELHRVLRPGGRLLLMEHVRASDEALAGVQDLVERPWTWCNGGCRPNRRTLEAVEQAGFTIQALDRYGFAALPHVEVVAVRS